MASTLAVALFVAGLGIIMRGASYALRVGVADTQRTDVVFAREPDTGKAHWAYQYSPHDLWDHSGVNENIVLDMDWEGAHRKVIVRPERDGYVYVLDRLTGAANLENLSPVTGQFRFLHGDVGADELLDAELPGHDAVQPLLL